MNDYREYLDNAIAELEENKRYGLCKGSEIDFAIFSDKFTKDDIIKYKGFDIFINPSQKDLVGSNLFMAIVKHPFQLEVSTYYQICIQILSRFHDNGKIININ